VPSSSTPTCSVVGVIVVLPEAAASVTRTIATISSEPPAGSSSVPSREAASGTAPGVA
jgi:hypothetical protein